MKWLSLSAVLSSLSLFFALVSSSAAPEAALGYAKDTLQESHGKIVFASLIFRHGDRAVNDIYPNDPYSSSTWREGLGELTQLGKKHAYELGQWFLERYADTLLADGYMADNLVMDSSDVNRTIMSGLLVLAGAYPPKEKEAWIADNLPWQPIPIHVISSEVDNMIGLRVPCERIDFEKELLSSIPELQQLYSKYKDEIQYTSEKSGNYFSSDDIFDLFEKLWDIYDILQIEMDSKTSKSRNKLVQTINWFKPFM